ncbi:MAG: hypothetical protein IPL03_04350 [Sterolibacteriaceae bacterium]|nr:hypothetical protein [Candidatus Methylophosphatis haderslevensis]
MPGRLFRTHELAFRTQYAELKERVMAAGSLLPGTPGSLALRSGTGHSYWYRVFYSVPGKVSETLVCKQDDEPALAAMREQIEFHGWVARQVSFLRKLGFQIADKLTARVLVELHNRSVLNPDLALVGTLAYMAWSNELGAIAASARTLDVDLARRQTLKLASPLSLLETVQATNLPFSAVPGLPSTAPSTSIKLPGVQGLRVDILAPGKTLGAVMRLPELDWAAQSVPFYDYLLEELHPGALLAGGHCVPIRLPQAARLAWHKLYASTQRKGFPEKASKDRQQALVLGALVAESEPHLLTEAFKQAPSRMTNPIRTLAKSLMTHAGAHPELMEILGTCLAR